MQVKSMRHRSMIVYAMASLLALLLLSGCAQATAVVTPGVTPTVLPAPTAEGGAMVITLAQDGGAITLRAGERLLLQFGEEYDWTVTVEDQSVLSRVVGVLTIRGAQGLYEAHKSGQTKLNAIGDPACRKAADPCEQPSRVFVLSVTVG
jgi:hypothetical protein